MCFCLQCRLTTECPVAFTGPSDLASLKENGGESSGRQHFLVIGIALSNGSVKEEQFVQQARKKELRQWWSDLVGNVPEAQA